MNELQESYVVYWEDMILLSQKCEKNYRATAEKSNSLAV